MAVEMGRSARQIISDMSVLEREGINRPRSEAGFHSPKHHWAGLVTSHAPITVLDRVRPHSLPFDVEVSNAATVNRLL
jgi:hypothetical protein